MSPRVKHLRILKACPETLVADMEAVPEESFALKRRSFLLCSLMGAGLMATAPLAKSFANAQSVLNEKSTRMSGGRTPDAIGLKREYRFDNFIIERGNLEAFQIAKHFVVEDLYGPLVVYGQTGVGKTHLLHAIANAIHAQSPPMKICCIHAYDFAMAAGHAYGRMAFEEFKRHYQTCDVLMISAIHCLSGEYHAQLVLNSILGRIGKSPRIGMSANICLRARSVYPGGLKRHPDWQFDTFITRPDFDTRLAFLNQEALRQGMALSPEILSSMARRIESNARELKGAIIRLGAYSRYYGLPITPMMVEAALTGFGYRT